MVICTPRMRPEISETNLDRLEIVTNQKISKNCDEVLGCALDELEQLKSEKEEDGSFDMTTCDETKSEMEDKDA